MIGEPKDEIRRTRFHAAIGADDPAEGKVAREAAEGCHGKVQPFVRTKGMELDGGLERGL